MRMGRIPRVFYGNSVTISIISDPESFSKDARCDDSTETSLACQVKTTSGRAKAACACRRRDRRLLYAAAAAAKASITERFFINSGGTPCRSARNCTLLYEIDTLP